MRKMESNQEFYLHEIISVEPRNAFRILISIHYVGFWWMKVNTKNLILHLNVKSPLKSIYAPLRPEFLELIYFQRFFPPQECLSPKYYRSHDCTSKYQIKKIVLSILQLHKSVSVWDRRLEHNFIVIFKVERMQ